MPVETLAEMPALPEGFRLLPGRPGTAVNDLGNVLSCLMRGRRLLGATGPRFRADWVPVSAASRKVKPVVPMPDPPEGVRLIPGEIGVGTTAEGVVMTCIRRGSRGTRGGVGPRFSPTWRVVPQHTNNHGYRMACVGGRVRQVHRLVLLAWVGEPQPGQECRHLDGDPLNNQLGNLAWGTRAENAADREAHGRTFRTTKAWPVKLTFEKAQAMRARAAAGVRQAQLARDFGVSETNVRHVLSGRSWRPEWHQRAA